MKIIKGILITIVVLAVAYIVTALITPKSYTVERSVEINAPSDIIFEKVSLFSNWNSWSPWKEQDPTSTYQLNGEDGIIGTTYSWSGDAEKTGTGGMTITEVTKNSKFAYDLAFTAPWQSSSKGHFSLSETNGVTTLTWADAGDIPFLDRPMMYFMDLEGMMGPMFERGLFKIDSLVTQ